MLDRPADRFHRVRRCLFPGVSLRRFRRERTGIIDPDGIERGYHPFFLFGRNIPGHENEVIVVVKCKNLTVHNFFLLFSMDFIGFHTVYMYDFSLQGVQIF